MRSRAVPEGAMIYLTRPPEGTRISLSRLPSVETLGYDLPSRRAGLLHLHFSVVLPTRRNLDIGGKANSDSEASSRNAGN